MGRSPPVLPAPTDILCEACGYILRGLAESRNCPECGRPIEQSLGGHRKPSAFEIAPSLRSLVRTALAVLLVPRRFFASLSTHHPGTRAAWFGRCHRAVTAALLAVAICGIAIIDHSFVNRIRPIYSADEPVIFGLLLAPVAVIIYASIAMLTGLLASLVAWVAMDRGIRLQRHVVARALDFHAVHWLMAALAVAVAVGGPRSLQITPLAGILYVVVARLTVWIAGGRGIRPHRGWALSVPVGILMGVTVAFYFGLFDSSYFDDIGAPPANWRLYLRAVTLVTIVALGWLLITGWIAIRNVMYANDRVVRTVEKSP